MDHSAGTPSVPPAEVPPLSLSHPENSQSLDGLTNDADSTLLGPSRVGSDEHSASSPHLSSLNVQNAQSQTGTSSDPTLLAYGWVSEAGAFVNKMREAAGKGLERVRTSRFWKIRKGGTRPDATPMVQRHTV